MDRNFKFIILSLLLIYCCIPAKVFAGVEPYEKSIIGTVKAHDTLIVKDEKFLNPAYNWADITNISVKNRITLRFIDGQPITYAFTCTANLKILYYSSPGQTTASDTTINLSVNYVPGQGAGYKGMDNFTFSNAYKIIVVVNSISSPQIGTALPSVFQLTGSIVIDRQYLFKPHAAIAPNAVIINTPPTSSSGSGPHMMSFSSMLSGGTGTVNSGNQLQLSWSLIPGAEDYDIEWTTVDTGDINAAAAAAMLTGGSVPPGYPDKLFRNNATRITTHQQNYLLSLVYNNDYILVRMRQVQYLSNGVRLEGDWDYHKDDGSYAVWNLTNWHQSNLNWQYSAAFAEEGKKKEVISYFDGTLRGRQTVTINNTDTVPVVQENVYDDFGRPAASILPAPVLDSLASPAFLHYFQNVNLNHAGLPYSYADLRGADASACEVNPDSLNTWFGASRYYSKNNPFVNSKNYKYIPDAEGFPLSVTQYTADNTGRIRIQGGVGKTFQPGKDSPSKTTKYYYAKPEQWELDQLFGNDVGYAEHYLKNMVVDANGQASVSYLNASGKTIATALTGQAPSNLDGLTSKPAPTRQDTKLIKPEQFIFDSQSLKLTANTTYLVSSVGDSAIFNYDVQKLMDVFTKGSTQICSSCYYDLKINVVNDCKTIVDSVKVPVGTPDSICRSASTQTGNFTIRNMPPGEYYITYELAFSKSILENYVDKFITTGQSKGVVRKEWGYVQSYLNNIDYSGCLSDCRTCVKVLGDSTDFKTMFRNKLLALDVDSTSISNHAFNTWVQAKYDSLRTICLALQGSCDLAPCATYERQMEQDVSPGGQYALFSAYGTPLEATINVLNLHWRHEFPVKLPSDTIYYQKDLVTKDLNYLSILYPPTPDASGVTSPYDTTFTLQDLVKYWKPEWAARFVKYHPENCKLLFCQQVSAYKNWDEQVKQFAASPGDIQNIPGAPSGFAYSTTNGAWLIAADPFFKSGGLGHGDSTLMKYDLDHYSSSVLANTHANKNLSQFVDYVLYCSDPTGTTNSSTNADYWTYGRADSTCRVPQRDWDAYKNYYFELKDKYYAQLRAATTCANACPVGRPYSLTSGQCPGYQDFAINTTSQLDAASAPDCTGMQGVTLTYLPGKVSAPVWVTLYFPAETYVTDTLHKFDTGTGKVFFCIPTSVPLSSIKIKSVSCTAPPPVCLTIPYNYYDDYNQQYIDNSVYPTVYSYSIATGESGGTGSPNLSSSFQSYIAIGGGSTTSVVWTQFLACVTFVTNGSPTTFYNVTVTKYVTDNSDTGGLEFQSFAALPSPVDGGDGGGGGTGTGSGEGGGTTVDCSLYQYKDSRFDIVSRGATLPTDTATALQQNRDYLHQQIQNSCEGNAVNWMQVLTPGMDALSTSTTDRNTLYSKLIEICSAGGDQNHPYGASDLTGDAHPANTSTYNNFGAAIRAVVLHGAGFTPTINPWLIDGPGPYAPLPQTSTETISSSTQPICDTLARLQTAATAAGLNLYDYLVQTYGSAMTLTSTEVTELQKSCSNCKFVIATDINLPVFLQPGTKGCISLSNYNSAKTDLQSQFSGGLPTTASNFKKIFTNFMNQRFGFALWYDQYMQFEAGGSNMLCNAPPYKAADVDQYACIEAQMAVAVANGKRDYMSYIEAQRDTFRMGYIRICSAAQANMNVNAIRQVYHYTLYYYDQADNLVRTVPPEGVTLLTTTEQQWVQQTRSADVSKCENLYHGPIIENKTAAFNRLSQIIDVPGSAMDMWLYNPTTGQSQTIQQSQDEHHLFQLCINNGLLNVDIYTSTPGLHSIAYTLSNHFTANISSMLPLKPWTHVMIQGNNLTNAQLKVYLNGMPLTAVNIPNAGCSWSVKGNANSQPSYPDNTTTLKYMRMYNRQLSDGEIMSNATDSCLLVTSSSIAALNGWYRFNVPARGSETTVAADTITESRFANIYPNHALRTTYAYNSTNQVVQQKSPDGGTNRFWYDLLSRLNISQNDKQLPHNQYSYTLYDVLGRITEVGQTTDTVKIKGTNYTDSIYLDTTTIKRFNYSGMGARNQITNSWYDQVPVAGTLAGLQYSLPQENLRKRVVVSTYRDSWNDGVKHGTYYNYDLDGNVKTLYQQIDGLGTKKMDYEYDLVSGKVNFVRYQDGSADQYYYKYSYDADNRITEAWTGTQAIVDPYRGSTLLNGKQDAQYFYYLHGPLARMELGDVYAKVQGVDYAYTLQGWLKGVNGQTLDPETEMGGDGRSGGNNNNVARDAYGYSLGYYAGDYKPIIGTATAFNIKYNSQSGDITGQSLYNGNISNTTMTISSINSGNPVGYSYHYDQLNRLKAVRQHNLASTVFDKSNMLQDYAENLTYDGNGNILTNNRHGNIASGIAMDSLRYGYRYDSNGKLVDNRLHQVQDAVPDVNGYTADLKNQSDTGNYKYDAIGNLVLDTQAGLDSINWNVYGKIKSIYKNTGTINYSYSPGGQRVTKTAVGLTTYYVRDAHGNMIALYDNANNTRNWREQHTYGSDRLSMWQPNVNLSLAQVADTVNARYNSVGLTQYELKNHLGNVMTTISDKRIQHITGGDVDYYLSDITSGQDYYAFGMLQAGRQYTANYTTYRYGFNGKENDNDVKGEGNQQDYGMRISDPRLGRFLSVDPITANYPWYTPYQFAGNTPMQAIDIDGLEEYVVTNFLNKAKQIVETQISFITDKATKENVDMQLITVHGKTPISPNSKVLVRNLDFDTEKLLSYERRQALNARELAVLKTGDKEKIKGYDPFSVQIEMGQPLESTADDYSTKDYELVSLSKQFRIAKPSPPPVAEFSNGILMNPGISNTDSYNYAVNNIIVPNIQATIKEAISKGMNAGKLSISITIDAKPATNVTAVKRLILSAYPKANVIINSRPDVKVLPGSSMRKSNEDFNYTINVKGGKE